MLGRETIEGRFAARDVLAAKRRVTDEELVHGPRLETLPGLTPGRRRRRGRGAGAGSLGRQPVDVAPNGRLALSRKLLPTAPYRRPIKRRVMKNLGWLMVSMSTLVAGCGVVQTISMIGQEAQRLVHQSSSLS